MRRAWFSYQIPPNTKTGPLRRFTASRGYLTPPVLIGLTIICLVVAATLLFNSFLIRKVKEPVTLPLPYPSDASPAPNGAGEIANWKTYKSNRFPYQIKYPGNFNVSDENLINEDVAESIIFFDYQSDFSLSTGVLNNPKELPPNEWYKDFIERNPDGYIEIPTQSNLKVDGYSAFKTSYPAKTSSEGFGETVPFQNVYIPKYQKIFMIGFTSKAILEDTKIFDQILSTFQFLD
ncbi:hypothetical protein HYU92_01035 [Candidatus Curtissbacteria bacterium]|nr:hypothetical protein [Candidatus Curtissbacteria bacterium]